MRCLGLRFSGFRLPHSALHHAHTDCVPLFHDYSSTTIQCSIGVGNAPGTLLKIPAPVLDNISGPMGARLLSSTGLGIGILLSLRGSEFLPAPAGSKCGLQLASVSNRSGNRRALGRAWDHLHGGTFIPSIIPPHMMTCLFISLGLRNGN